MFENLHGNDEIKTRLSRLVEQNKLPQSLILAGRDGIGKKQFALELARTFVCTEPNALPCGKCSACQRVFHLSLPTSTKKEDYTTISYTGHPDVGLIVPNRNTIYVDAVRHLASEAFFRPYEGRARVFIIDEAEKLGLTQKSAANALLKTLEEPADTSYLILVTSKPSSLLQTIRSRCQMIRFAAVEDTEIAKLLVASHGYSEPDARLAAKIANGSIAGAVRIDLETYKQTRETFLQAVEGAFAKRGLATGRAASDEISSRKGADDFDESLELLESLLRDLILIKYGDGGSITNFDIGERLNSIADLSSTDTDFPQWIEEVEKVRSALRFNVNKRVAADALFARLAA